MPIGQMIEAAAAEEMACKAPVGEEQLTAKNIAVAENPFSGGLHADGFVKVCLRLMRDNFLTKVRA